MAAFRSRSPSRRAGNLTISGLHAAAAAASGARPTKAESLLANNEIPDTGTSATSALVLVLVLAADS